MVAWATASAAHAQSADIPGSKDPPFLKRFEGSQIVAYATKPFDEYTLALGEATDAGFEKSEHLEGTITRIVYRVPAGHTQLELLRNYEHALGEAGFSLSYERKAWEADSRFMVNFYKQAALSGSNANPFYIGGIAGSNGTYVAAKTTKAGQDITVAVLIHQTGAFNWTIAAAKDPIAFKNEEIIVGVDVITAKAVEIKMVEVKAADMAAALASKGTVSLYGIYFDVDKAEIKPESDKTLAEIENLMKSDRALKLEISGHTDNTGDKTHNIGLSQDRAAAVVDALVKKHGIEPARLQAKGYGDAKPVAPNDTEDGRAKNRRVELRKM
jgi:OmpA-OmpF porin, OOP family